MSKEQLEEQAEQLAAAVKEQETKVSALRRIHKAKEDIQAGVARRTSECDRMSPEESVLYTGLREARSATRDVRAELFPEVAKTRQLRQELYYCNRMIKAPKTKNSNGPAQLTQVSPEWTKVEDATEFLDISELLQSARCKKKRVVFSGSDYGLCTMSETVAQTLQEIEVHLNKYEVLFGHETEVQPGLEAAMVCTIDDGSLAGHMLHAQPSVEDVSVCDAMEEDNEGQGRAKRRSGDTEHKTTTKVRKIDDDGFS
ncbi:hypothetical protein BGZ98_007895, partial [Dissophora globulifera]